MVFRPLGEHLGLPPDPRPTQFTIPMEDIRTISRQIAREEIELAKESLRGNYQYIQSSIVATAVPIVFRRVDEALPEKVHEEIEKSILHSQKPAYRDEKERPTQWEDQHKTKEFESVRTTGAKRHTSTPIGTQCYSAKRA